MKNKNDQHLSKIGRNMIWLMWLLILGVVTLFFNDIVDKQKNPNQNNRSSSLKNGSEQVILIRNRFGQYITDGKINGQKVVFMIDTGASDISIPIAVANRLNLTKGRQVQYETANGTAMAYETRLDSVSIAGIRKNKVKASINPNVDYEEILLGMSFLKDLEFSQQGKNLIIKQR